jgi:MSHA biogenesis protein MshJ
LREGTTVNSQWQVYGEKFQGLTSREQYLILATGLFIVLFVSFTWFIEPNLIESKKLSREITQLSQSIRSNEGTIRVLQEALNNDPNVKTNQEIEQFKEQLERVDEALVALTSELISPNQMRNALVELLSLKPGVRLVSFEIQPAIPLIVKAEEPQEQQEKVEGAEQQAVADEESVMLYRHAMEIKLSGSYFQLRDYLVELENLQWRFFWHGFDYQLESYPKAEMTIKVYSLSTNKDFIGV